GSTATDTDTATVTYTNVAPAIQVVKSASRTSVSATGGSVTYTYLVANTSPAAAFDPLSSVSLSDTDGTPTLVSKSGGDQDNLLEAGETWTYTLTFAMPPGNATGATHVNTVPYTTHFRSGSTATDTDTATVTYTNVAPAIQVVK